MQDFFSKNENEGALELENDLEKVDLRSQNVVWKRGSLGRHIPPSNMSAPPPGLNAPFLSTNSAIYWIIEHHDERVNAFIDFFVYIQRYTTIILLQRLILMHANSFNSDTIKTSIIYMNTRWCYRTDKKVKTSDKHI